jgi:N-methylhydantoinase A/oxoprolinase/acetone carboxylase beta subunit
MASAFARRYPVLTFASGPTNSMRGAAYLSGLQNAIVVDVGGTTSDIGALSSGFPREASVAVDVGGVRTNFRMPDVLSIGIGGGSKVSLNPLRVGPESVGRNLTEEALVFGGDTFTATDAAVAVGGAAVGNPALVSPCDRARSPAVPECVRARLVAAVADATISAQPVPVIVIGGGTVLLPDGLPGAPALVRPEHYQVANAIGAAIAQVSGEVDHVRAMGSSRTRADLIEEARRAAVERAVDAGADAGTVTLVEAEDVPLSYLPGDATRVRVKVVGDLRGLNVAG